MAPVGLLLLHIALALGASAAGEAAEDASSYRCYLPQVFNETDEFENATENRSNMDVRGCDTSTGPLTAAQCFLRCVEGYVLAEAGPTLARRGWAICPEEGGVFLTPKCVAERAWVFMQDRTVGWNVPVKPVAIWPCPGEGGCHSIEISLDGQLLLTAGTPVQVWDLSTPSHVRESDPLSNSSAEYVAIAGGGKWAFTFSEVEGEESTRTISKWALDDRSRPIWEHRINWFTPNCSRPLVSPDGESMAFACNGSMGLFDVASGSITELAPVPMEDTAMEIGRLLMGAAGSWFAAVVYSDVGSAYWVWSPSRGSPRGTTQFHQWSPEGADDGDYDVATHDGRHILSSTDHGVNMYAVWTGERVASFSTGIPRSWVTAMAVSQDDDWLWGVVAEQSREFVEHVALWNMRTGSGTPALTYELSVTDPEPRAALTLDGRFGFVIAGKAVYAYELQLRPARSFARFEMEDMFRYNYLYYYGLGPSRTEDEYAFVATAGVADGRGGQHDTIVSHGLSLRTRNETGARAPADPGCVPTGTVETRSSSGWLLCSNLSNFNWGDPVRLRNVFTGRVWNISVGFNISAAALTPNGARLFVLGRQQRGAWTLAAWALLGDDPSPSGMWTLPTPDRYGDALDIQAGPSGKLVLITLDHKTMQWELQPDHARLLCSYDWSERFLKMSPLPPVVIAPDESELIKYSSAGFHTIEAWSLRSCLPEPLTTFIGVPDDVISEDLPGAGNEFKISPDGNWVAFVAERTVRFWDRHTSNSEPQLAWILPVGGSVVSTSLDGAWVMLTHGLGVDVWPLFHSSAYDRAIKEVYSVDSQGTLTVQTSDAPKKIPSWLAATSLRALDLHNANLTDFDLQVPSTLLCMNLSGARAQKGGLKLRASWLQNAGITIDLRGVPDVDVGELLENPRLQRDTSSCAADFDAHGVCMRRHYGEGVRRLADGRICSSAFTVWGPGSDDKSPIKRAAVYADAASLNRWLCDCPEGTHGDGEVCAACPQDSYCPAPRPNTVQADNEVERQCATGSGTNGARNTTSNASCSCRPGWHSVGRGGRAPCQPCEEGSFAASWGSEMCGMCGFGWLPNDVQAGCVLHGEYLAALLSLAALSACVAMACPLACGRGVPIADVALEDGKVVITTTRNHRILHRAPAAFNIHMHGTGSPGLDRRGDGLRAYPAPFKVRVLSSKRLMLLDPQGASITAPLDTSQGEVRVQVPQAFLALGAVGIPIGVLMLVVLALWASSVAALFRLDPFSPNRSVVAVVLGFAVAFGLAKHWRWQRAAARSPIRLEIEKFRGRIRTQNPHPRACERGPGRAVTMAQLDDLHKAFQAFIRDTRTMHYLWENVLKPITAPEKLSYAELVGPSVVEWFCSHFWGSPFAHFAESVRKHAQAVGEREGRNARLMSYWICSLSNNQWRIADELPGQWQDSSFYLALCSGRCRGTTMILDEEATPLTRSWCLFEVLQTLKLSREDTHFQGLVLCTSTGALNYGEARLDVAMAMAEHLVKLDLHEAKASVAADKAMIDELVVRDFGGFDLVNDFVRGRIREALDTMRVRVDLDMSRLASALAGGAPVSSGPPASRQSTHLWHPLPTLLVSSPQGLSPDCVDIHP